MSPLDTLKALPAYTDNYIWVWSHGGQAFVVDPGDAGPVQRYLAENELTLGAVLVTHHHPDHVHGIAALLREQDAPVYGPANSPFKGITQPLREGAVLELGGLRFEIMETPGHTLDHIAYVHSDLLFCGDTLFAGGCGRLFEGSPEQMHRSLQKLAALPTSTRVCCTHEYTLANLTFAAAARPTHEATLQRLKKTQDQRHLGEITLPSTIEIERETNPFLCVDDVQLQDSLIAAGRPASTEVETFASLRAWKDEFKG